MGHSAASGYPMPDATFLKIPGAKLENLFHLNNEGVESHENNSDRMSAGLLQHLLFGSPDK